MTKSSTLVIFLLGILIAQAACARPKLTRSKSVRSKSSNAPTEVTGTPNNQPKSAPTSTTSEPPKADDTAPWILPGFDKNQISQLRVNKNGRKCWQNAKYHVCLTKTASITKLYWKNERSRVQVEIEISNEGEIINQSWKYPDANVQLSLDEDGSSEQRWKFGSSDELQVSTYSDGTRKTKWFGSERVEDVEKAKKFIDSWCENNDFFVGKENCAIYDKINVNKDPAWILSGFDKNQVSQLNKNGRKCWQNAKYHVCLTKNASITKLYWKNEKSNTKVEIDISSDGNIVQDWTYQGNNVQISRDEDGCVAQAWRLGSSTFQINKCPNEAAESKWYGVENSEALKKYQEFIDAWCENNEFFVKNDECKIYAV